MDFEILLIGSDVNTYYMARCYHELTGKCATTIANEPLQFTKHSGILNIIYKPGIKDKKVFTKALLDYAKEKNFNDKILLIPCHDVYVRLLVENYDSLKKYYICNVPDRDIVDGFLVKEKFYNKYKNKLDLPKTVFYDCSKSKKIKDEFTYPVILKPSNGIEYYRHKFEGQDKVFRIESFYELRYVVDKIVKSGYKDTLVIQDYIPGDDTNLFDVVFYVDSKKCIELATFANIGLQEHVPSAIGNATVLINGYDIHGCCDEVISELKQFLLDINYNGFAEFDLKYDNRTNTFKVLEINPRQARSSYYLCACGYNLVKLLYDDLFLNKSMDFRIVKDEMLLSMVPIYVIRHYIDNKEYVKYAVKLYKNKKIVDPLNYKGDKSFKQKIYLFLRKVNYIKKYRKYNW